ncbi:unnamed protein product [Leptidea sinapis]|uniref:Uncharacterized protein n=1 Tax=Leptidea sinapis TaxID=189913 RepID=A0A5E4PYP3_9NEOP|nr:unnamed protein product [Leptidea sinapis]
MNNSDIDLKEIQNRLGSLKENNVPLTQISSSSKRLISVVQVLVFVYSDNKEKPEKVLEGAII